MKKSSDRYKQSFSPSKEVSSLMNSKHQDEKHSFLRHSKIDESILSMDHNPLQSSRSKLESPIIKKESESMNGFISSHDHVYSENLFSSALGQPKSNQRSQASAIFIESLKPSDGLLNRQSYVNADSSSECFTNPYLSSEMVEFSRNDDPSNKVIMKPEIVFPKLEVSKTKNVQLSLDRIIDGHSTKDHNLTKNQGQPNSNTYKLQKMLNPPQATQPFSARRNSSTISLATNNLTSNGQLKTIRNPKDSAKDSFIMPRVQPLTCQNKRGNSKDSPALKEMSTLIGNVKNKQLISHQKTYSLIDEPNIGVNQMPIVQQKRQNICSKKSDLGLGLSNIYKFEKNDPNSKRGEISSGRREKIDSNRRQLDEKSKKKLASTSSRETCCMSTAISRNEGSLNASTKLKQLNRIRVRLFTIQFSIILGTR